MPLDNNYELSSSATDESLLLMTIVRNYVHDVQKGIYHKRSTHCVENVTYLNINYWDLVDEGNVQVKHRNKKSLTCKSLGPYKVLKAIASNAYQLKVPEGTRWCNLVHTTILKPLRRRDEC